MPRSNVLLRLALSLLAVGNVVSGIAPAAAQAWPPLTTIVVPFPPGASNDTFARILAQKLGPKLNTNVIVDNKPGAGGSIGAALVARAAPTGATLMLSSSTFTGSAAVMAGLPYDPIAGFTPIAQLAKGPMILVVGPKTPFASVAGLLEAARAAKGKLNYGTAGIGSINHMATELLASMAKVEITHVPYRGMANATTDLLSGQIELIIASFPSVASHMKAGTIRGLAVTSAGRSPFASDLPPIGETVSGYEIDLWWGVFGPAGMAPALAERLNGEIRSILAEEDMRQRFALEGAVAASTSPAEFAAIVKADLEKLRTIARERNITAN